MRREKKDEGMANSSEIVMVRQKNDEGHMKATPGGLKRKDQVQFCGQIYSPGKLASCSSKKINSKGNSLRNPQDFCSP